MNKKTKKTTSNLICDNRKARHDYELIEQFEAGLVLEGWEVKSLRAGRGQLRDSYIVIRSGEAWLVGAHFSTLSTTSKQTDAEPTRSRKLLLSRKELNKLCGAIAQKGLTAVPINLHWKNSRVKIQMALAKGKKTFDKRETLKRKAQERDMNRSRRDR